MWKISLASMLYCAEVLDFGFGLGLKGIKVSSFVEWRFQICYTARVWNHFFLYSSLVISYCL